MCSWSHEMSLQSSMLSWKPIHKRAAWSAISRATNVGPELLVTLPKDLNKNARLGNRVSRYCKAEKQDLQPEGRAKVHAIQRCMRLGGLLQAKKAWILFARPVIGQPYKVAHQICKAHTRMGAVTSPDPGRLIERSVTKAT